MNKKIIKYIAIIEFIIGSITLVTTLVLVFLSSSTKPFNVFIFVVVSSIFSIIIGIELLKYKNWARNLLLFFSGYVMLTKFLVYFNLLNFSGEFLTLVPTNIRDAISILYHAFVMYFLSRKYIRYEFVRQR